MTACVTGGPGGNPADARRAPDHRVPVRVTLDYPEGCEPTEGYPHRYVVSRGGYTDDPVPVSNPAEPFVVRVEPGTTLTVMTAVCRLEDGACCPVTGEYRFAAGNELPVEIVVEIPDPRVR